MKKFLVIFAVATVVAFQGFAQKVNPWLRGDNNKTTAEMRAYWLDGVVPNGIISTLKHDEIVRAIEQSFGNAGIKEDWAVVVVRSKCIDPPIDLTKRKIPFWGSLGGQAKHMEAPRFLRKDEKIFVDPVTNMILGGCQCANLLVVPMSWNEPLCEPETPLQDYSTIDDSAPVNQKREQTINTTVEIDPSLFQGQGSGSSSQPASATASANVDSRSRSYADDCTWCGLEDRDGYIRAKDVKTFFEIKHDIDRRTNDEYIRVKEAESDIRRDDMINMMIAQNMCNNCQETGRSMSYQGTNYVEVQQRGSRNEWLAPLIGGAVGGFAGGALSHLVFNQRGGRPQAQQWRGNWQQQQTTHYQPPVHQQQGWEQTVGSNGWNSNGAVGLGGFVPTNGR